MFVEKQNILPNVFNALQTKVLLKSHKGEAALRLCLSLYSQPADLSLNRLKKSTTVHVYLLDRTSCCLVRAPVHDSRVAPPVETMPLHHAYTVIYRVKNIDLCYLFTVLSCLSAKHSLYTYFRMYR